MKRKRQINLIYDDDHDDNGFTKNKKRKLKNNNKKWSLFDRWLSNLKASNKNPNQNSKKEDEYDKFFSTLSKKYKSTTVESVENVENVENDNNKKVNLYNSFKNKVTSKLIKNNQNYSSALSPPPLKLINLEDVLDDNNDDGDGKTMNLDKLSKKKSKTDESKQWDSFSNFEAIKIFKLAKTLKDGPFCFVCGKTGSVDNDVIIPHSNVEYLINYINSNKYSTEIGVFIDTIYNYYEDHIRGPYYENKKSFDPDLPEWTRATIFNHVRGRHKFDPLSDHYYEIRNLKTMMDLIDRNGLIQINTSGKINCFGETLKQVNYNQWKIKKEALDMFMKLESSASRIELNQRKNGGGTNYHNNNRGANEKNSYFNFNGIKTLNLKKIDT